MASFYTEQHRTFINEVIDSNSTVLTLKQDVSTLKQDVSTLKQDVSTLKEDVSGLKVEQHRQGLLMETMNDKLNTIAEAVLPLATGHARMSTQEQTISLQADQIKVTQQVLQQHIANSTVHRASLSR